MKILLSLLVLCFTSLTFANEAPLAKMESQGGNIYITFTDFANLGSFETYECKVDMGSWVYTLTANKIVVNGEDMYRCTDFGSLSSNTRYPVWIVFENWPYDRKSQTATFNLKVE